MRGKRAMDGAAPELGQDDPLRGKRNPDAVSYPDTAPAPASASASAPAFDFDAKPNTAVALRRVLVR